MSDAVYRAALALEMEAPVDLYELDCTELTTVYGETGKGDVYRWSPGVLDYRDEGYITNTSGTTTTLVLLDRLVPILSHTAQTFLFSFSTSAGGYCEPVRISGSVTNAGVTLIGLATPLPEIPAIGAVWYIQSAGSIYMGGVEYKPVPIECTGMEWSGTGKLPRPRLKISNIGGLPTALVVQFGDIVGATVTRIRTFRDMLDGEPNSDPSALSEPEIFRIDRKSRHDKTEIEWELAPELDQMGIMLPRRVVIRDVCDYTYRKWVTNQNGARFVYGSCPYAGTAMYTRAGQATGDPTQDECGKHMLDCVLRFGAGNPIEMQAFPGVSERAA